MISIAPRSLEQSYYPFGFSLSAQAWRQLDIEGLLLNAAPDRASRVRLLRTLAERINKQRDFTRPDVQPARAGELMALGLLSEVLRFVAEYYCGQTNPGVIPRAERHIMASFGAGALLQSRPVFMEEFPPQGVWMGKESPEAFLGRAYEQLNNTERLSLEMLLLQITRKNPALKYYRPLFDETELKRRAPFALFVREFGSFFSKEPPVPETGQSLLATLMAPIEAHPNSIEAQLAYIQGHWRHFLPAELLEALELAEGILKEETALRGLGPGPVDPLRFGQLEEAGYEEFEAFSIDKDWMPNVVLIAKTVYVWLDQLSKKYRRDIHRLDHIPDEELDRLGRWGFTGLWLIGLWERSPASSTIKRIMGNPEAVASAYSLYDYVIASDLGGEEAYQDLASRAWKRGIRLASDMVPNHVGIYSKWVIEHPDWFIQSARPPFPSYAYSGVDLSDNEGVGLYIEDGYWNHTDAAVVFKRVDHATGETRYIYHGNDGTSMPWNDTAQLDFTKAEVRQAVIQTVIHVAKKFPIIRFDAAMTLAKRHYQRLWFPKPGDAGAIPSRAEHGMSKQAFDEIFPVEFWREVVDRIAVEAPDTLLLAEAFWLMEGYFVRTLGMHRVYNSAFMNMLKMEENAKYRQTIKNVLEFSPEVLQRFVNFMNNPDEDTAVAQFGKSDKYIGVAVLMVTMPGLPMFGHGQIEGLTEKYGMEYRRAYWEEEVDQALVAWHERAVFPLMRLRHIFSGARHFALFDFVAPEGHVDENVFAYSNRNGAERSLIVYNNAYNDTRGCLHTSTAINEGPADAPELHRRPLAEALKLNTEPTCYYIYKNLATGLEYLEHGQRLAEYGIHLDLHAYEYCALLHWREIHDFDCSWGALHASLGGRGVPSVEDAYKEMHLASVLEPFRALLSPDLWERLSAPKLTPKALEALRKALIAFLEAIAIRLEIAPSIKPIADHILAEIAHWRDAPALIRKAKLAPHIEKRLLAAFPEEDGFPLAFWRVPLATALLRSIGAIAAPDPMRALEGAPGFDIAATSGAWLQEWFLAKQIAKSFESIDGDAYAAAMDARLVRAGIAWSERLTALREEPWAPTLAAFFGDPDMHAYLEMNHFDGQWWIRKERLETLIDWLFRAHAIHHCNTGTRTPDEIALYWEELRILREAAEDCCYNFNGMMESIK